MSDVNIGAKITVDTGNTAQSVNQMKDSIKNLQKELNNAKVGSEEYTQAQNKLKTAQYQLSSSTKEKTSTFGQLKDQLKGTVPAFDGAASGAISFGKQLLALMANPIVLIIAGIVLGLKFLYDAFTYTVAGGKKVEQVFAGITSAIQVIVDRVMLVGNAIGKFFSGDWKGASKDMKEAFSGIGDAIGKAYDQVSKATAALQALKKAERESSVARAQQNAAIVRSKELLNDENATIKEKKAALAEVGAFEKKIGEEDVERAKEKLKQNKIIWGQTKEGLKKHAQDVADSEIEIANKTEETARKEIQLQRQNRTLNKQEKAEKKEVDDKAAAEKKERLQNIREYTNKIQKLQQEQELALTKEGYEKDKKVLQNQFEESKRDLKLQLEEKKITQKQYNSLLFEEQRLQNFKLLELEKKHNEELRIEETKIAAAKDAFMKRALGHTKEIEDEEIKIKIKGRADFIKRLDSELKLQQAQKIATIQIEREAYDLKRELEKQALIEAKASSDEMTAFENESAIARIALSKAESEAKVKNLETVGVAIGQLGELAGQQTVVGKVLAIGQAIMNTYLGFTKALAQGGVFGAIAGAGVIAAGLSAVRKIIEVQVPGGGGSASIGSPSIATSAPLTPGATGTVINQGSVRQLNNAQAVQAYVVEGQGRDTTERINRLNRAATFG